jgi:hypothetical protein
MGCTVVGSAPEATTSGGRSSNYSYVNEERTRQATLKMGKLTFRRKAPLSPRSPQVCLGANKDMVAEPFVPGVVTVLRVDGTELVTLALLLGDSVVELAKGADWVALAGPCEVNGVGAAVIEPGSVELAADVV